MSIGIDEDVSAEIQILKENRRRVRMNEGYDNWTEVADEDLWEDGELNKMDVAMKLFVNIVSRYFISFLTKNGIKSLEVFLSLMCSSIVDLLVKSW